MSPPDVTSDEIITAAYKNLNVDLLNAFIRKMCETVPGARNFAINELLVAYDYADSGSDSCSD